MSTASPDAVPAVASPATVPATAPPPAIKPLRIKTLTLTDFRAFPGPAPQAIEFGGKNLLVYGENGAGKSSIFHALRAVFTDAPAGKRGSLAAYKNKFSTMPVGGTRVDIEFEGWAEKASWALGVSTANSPAGESASPAPANFAVERHPFVMLSELNKTAFRRAATRAACLDYRALLDTNYKHGTGEIDLFNVAVNHLLRDFEFIPPGGRATTVGALWDKVNIADKSSVIGSSATGHKAPFLDDCRIFNESMEAALTALRPLVSAVLTDLGQSSMVIRLVYGPVAPRAAWYKRDRKLIGGTISPKINYRGHELDRPQDFLNEARLSALALSVYLAGRLACTPTETGSTLKLLVLDDVLVGLDHANRLPVLDLLQQHFLDWQIVLLTHDRGWFDLARGRLDKKQWNCVEIFEGDQSAPAPIPMIRATGNRPAIQYLAHAKTMLASRYIEASANYARQAFESTLRGGCELNSIHLAFKQNIKDVQAEDLLSAVEVWSKEDHARKTRFEPILIRLRFLRTVVMNPYSHPTAPNIPTIEVQAAIDEVQKLIDAFNFKPPRTQNPP